MYAVSSLDRAENYRTQSACAAVAGAATIAAMYAVPHPAVPIAIAAAPLALAIAYYRPFLLCLIFVAFSFFRIHEAIPALHPLQIPLAIGALTLLALTWHMFIARTVQPFWPRELKLFAAFFLLTTLGMVLALNPLIAFNYWTGVFDKIAITTIAIAWLMRTPADVNLASRVFVLCGLLISSIAIHNAMTGVGLVGGTRVTIGRELLSPIGDPNDLALALLFPLGFATAFAINRTGFFNRLIGLGTIPAILTAIIFTQSRGGLIGVLTVFAAVGLRSVKSKGLVVAAGLAMALILVSAMKISDRADISATATAIDESSMDRLYAWRAAVNMALARPLNGVGLSNFSESIFFYADHWSNFRDMVAHSTWFTVLAETGFPGFILFVLMVAAIYSSASQSLRLLTERDAPPVMRAMALGLTAALAGFCAAGTFLTQTFTWPIYILLALTVAMRRMANDFVSRSASQHS